MLLLEVLIKVGEKYLIHHYIFMALVKRSQSALQIKTKSLFCMLQSRMFRQSGKWFDLTQQFCCCRALLRKDALYL